MKCIKSLIALFLMAFITSHAEQQDEEVVYGLTHPKNVQVLIENGISEALLEVTGPYYIYNPLDGSKVASGILGKRFIVHALEPGLKWGEYFSGIHQIYIVPRSEKTSILVNGIEYHGAMAIYQVEDKISIVNDLDVEHFIKATLSPKFPYPLEKETMAAIAIVARTNVYFHIVKSLGRFWHLDAKTCGYLGHAMSAKGSEIDIAVDNTHDLILTNNNEPFAATWNQHCAGKTAPYETIFRNIGHCPDTVVKSDHAAFDRKGATWGFQMSMKKIACIFDVKEISSIELYTDKESGKTYAVHLRGKDTDKQVNFFDFQRKLGQDLLQSNDFSVEEKSDELTFTGYGKGHGVGLCLHTASALSQNGENAVNLLNKFYPETKLVNLSATLSDKNPLQ